LKMTMMDAAIKYAEANIPVMPLHWICEDGSCSCKAGSDCDSKGKHPLYTGKNTPTGEKSDWLVLDVEHMENFRIRLLLLQEVEVGTMSLNTLKAGVSQIRPSLHRVLIRVQQVDSTNG